MSIPLKATTYEHALPCLSEVEGAPVLTFRHATRLDKHTFQDLAMSERLLAHSTESLRKAVIEELKVGWQSENLAHNITRLEALWDAQDSLAEAMKQHREICLEMAREADEGEEMEFPAKPELEFPEDEVQELTDIQMEVRRHSDRVAKMFADNQRYERMQPRLLLRMFLKGVTGIDVEIKRVADVITAESAEELIDAIDDYAIENGVERGVAADQLMLQSYLAFAMTKEEEKNSSSPPSGSTSQKRSAKKQSSGQSETSSSKSTAPKTTAKASG